MIKPKRLSGLGEINYRNVGIGFSIGVLLEIQKELDDKCKLFRIIKDAEKALAQVLKELPDEMTIDQIDVSTKIFFELEKFVLYNTRYRDNFMSDRQREEVCEMIVDGPINDGTDYI